MSDETTTRKGFCPRHGLNFGIFGCIVCMEARRLEFMASPDAPDIPPKIDPDKEPHLVALRRIADALEMANVIARGE